MAASAALALENLVVPKGADFTAGYTFMTGATEATATAPAGWPSEWSGTVRTKLGGRRISLPATIGAEGYVAATVPGATSDGWPVASGPWDLTVRRTLGGTVVQSVLLVSGQLTVAPGAFDA